MNDLDDRLTDLLRRSADAVAVRPDLDAVIDDDVVVPFRARADRRRPRRAAFALVAAAVLLVAVVAAVALAGIGGDESTEGVTDAPTGPAERYPILDALPADLEGRVVARGGPIGGGTLFYLRTFAEDTPVTRAVLGRVADDGTVTGAMVVYASPGRMEADSVIPGAVPTTIAGRPADVWVDSGSGSVAAVIVGDGASALVHGPPGTDGVLAGIERVRIEAGDDRPVLEIDGLPDGLEVLVPPGPLEAGEGVEVGAGELGEPSVTVSTGIDDPLAVVAESGGTAEAVDIGGSPGWMVEYDEGEAMVTWRGPGGVALIARGRLSPEDILLVARGVRLVDEATWLATYGDAPDGIPVDEVDGPVGLPAPALEGITYDDRWTVVGMTRGGCPGEWCADAVFDALVGVENDPGATEIQLVGLVDETEGDGVADAQAVGFDGPVVLSTTDEIMRSWHVPELPAFAIVDPDGGVVHSAVGMISTEEILSALASSFPNSRYTTPDDDTTTTSVPERLGRPAPEFDGAMAEVGTFTPPQDRGEWAIVTIGRADCPMCVEQVEVLADYLAEHPDGPGSPVSLLVDEDEGFPERIAAFADEHGAGLPDWPVLAITEEQEALWGATGGGAVVVIDPYGLVQVYVGGFDDADELADMLEEVGAT